MPLYEYRCDVCGHLFEVIRKFSDPPLASCPKCNGVVTKLASSPAIHFKGSGWYITDYARAGKSDGDKPAADKGEGAGSSSETASESKGESKADSKTDAKAESKTQTKTESKAEPKPDSKPSSSTSSTST
jgi:putative FmdB family regulatory protein